MKLLAGVLVTVLAVAGCTQSVGGDPFAPRTTDVAAPIPEAAEGPCPDAADLTEVVSPGTFSFGPRATNVQVTRRVGLSHGENHKIITTIAETGSAELFVRAADNDAPGTLVINNSKRTVFLKSEATCPQKVRDGAAYLYEGEVTLTLFIP